MLALWITLGIIAAFGAGFAANGFMLGFRRRAAITARIESGVARRLMGLEEEVARRLEAKLLGPHAPEGGKTVVARLRQAGFTVLEKLTPARSHMLGWLQIRPAHESYRFICSYCGGKFHELHEIVEDTNHPFISAFLVADVTIGRFCNVCGELANESKETESGLRTVKWSCLGKLLHNAGGCNLFDILDHLQQQSGVMSGEIASWLRQRRELLDREATKIGEALKRHGLEAAPAADGPYRDPALPEPDDVPRMLKRHGEGDASC